MEGQGQLLSQLVGLLLPTAAPLQAQPAAWVAHPGYAPAVRLAAAPVPQRPWNALNLRARKGAVRAAVPVMTGEGRTAAAEILSEAKNEEEEKFLKMVEESAQKARSPESLAAERERGVAAAAVLRSTLEAQPDGLLAAAIAAKGKKKSKGKVWKALKKPKGTLALVCEGVSVDSISLGGYDLNDPKYLSEEFRKGGCSAVSVRVACEKSLAEDALQTSVEEQEVARGQFPGPLPVIARGPIVDELQLAEAAAAGAEAVVLPLALNGLERTGELMAEAELLGLEVMLRVCSEEQLGDAMGLEPKMVVIGDVNLEQGTKLLEGLPDSVIAVADIPTLDVRGVWQVRDAGFGSLISGEDLLRGCIRDRVPPQAIIKAMLSKGSAKYGLGFQKGRLEGAKEFLGSIAM